MTTTSEAVLEQLEAALDHALGAAGPSGSCATCRSSAHGREAFRTLATTWWNCERCGDYYVDPQPDPEALARLRRSPLWAAYLLATGQEDAAARSEADLANAFAKLGRDVYPYYRRHGSLLDVGAGTGAMVRAANEQKLHAEGLETDDQLCELASRLNGVKLRRRSLADSAFRKGSFSVITMHFALECEHDPDAALAAAHQLLDATGVLVIETPTADSTNFTGATAPLLRPLEQLRLHRAANVVRLVERAGLRLLDCYSPNEDTVLVCAEAA